MQFRVTYVRHRERGALADPHLIVPQMTRVTSHDHRYVAANLDGVHAGCALVDRVLSMVDPVLFNYLESKFLTANIYAFPLVMSLHACVPPLEEAVKLWDAVFSFGVHLEVLVCVAQVYCCCRCRCRVVVVVVVMVVVVDA